jgi:hypothetical protein
MHRAMKNLLNRLTLALPRMRRLVDENGRLRSAIVDAELELQKRTQELSALQSELLNFTELQGGATEAAVIADRESARRGQELWVPVGHFYSPLVDYTDESVQCAMQSEEHPTTPPDYFGISEEEMTHWFDVVANQYATHPFPERRTSGSKYYYSNPNFPLADALALLAFMVTRRPKRLIEIGAGFSTCAAIDINERYLNGEVEMTFIEPHPELALELIGQDSPYRDRFLATKLQNVSLDIFQALGSGDILFIDSSHIAKTGSDVLDYIFRILPCLGPNVLVHIHDVFYPFEYPREWIADQNRSWNEAYLLRAFMHGNDSVRVLYFSDWFYKCRRPLVAARMPLCISHRGGSLWIETTAR